MAYSFLGSAAGAAGSGSEAIPVDASAPEARSATDPVSSVVLDVQPSSAMSDEEAQFKDFVRRFHKVYISEADKEAHFAIFKANLADIRAENAKDHSYTLGITQFADMLPDDFAAMFSQPLSTPKGLNLGVHKVSGNDLPESKNWSEMGAVSEVKNQLTCGSCWSFASTGALEGAWQIATGHLVSMSEQQLIDCTTELGNQGCHGGAIERAIAYLAAGRAVCTEDSYPYKAEQGTCRESSCNAAIPGRGVTGFIQVPRADGDDALMDAVAQQPVAVAIEADHKVFMHYKHGIIKKKCGNKVDHGVLLVGYGTDNATNMSYWILKNSWGDQWGEHGFARLERGLSGTGECGIKYDPVYAQVDAEGDPFPIVAELPYIGLCGFFVACSCLRRLVCRRRVATARQPNLQQDLLDQQQQGAAAVAAATTAAPAPPTTTTAAATQAH